MKVGYVAFVLKVLALNSVASVEISEIDTKRKPVFGDDVKLNCGNEKIALEISAEYISKNSDWITDSKRLCLTDRKCCARQMGDKFFIDIDEKFTGCGNQISTLEAVNQNGSLSVTHYKFTNKLSYDGGSGSIARDTLLLNFHCLYTSDLLVTARPDESDLSSRVIRIKKISGEMEVSESSTFDRESTVLRKEKVYIKMKIENPVPYAPDNELNIVSVMKSCAIQDREIEHQIIDNGCPLFNDVEMFYKGPSLESKFGIQLNQFTSTKSANATIRCLVDLCLIDQSNTCKQECNGRTKRSVTSSVEETKSNSTAQQKYLLKFQTKVFSKTVYLSENQQFGDKANSVPATGAKLPTDKQKKAKNWLEIEKDALFGKEKLNKDLLLICIMGSFGVVLILISIVVLFLLFKRKFSKIDHN